MTSNPRIGDSGNYFDFTAFEEATVETDRPRCLHRRARRHGQHRHQDRRQRLPRQRCSPAAPASTFESEPEGRRRRQPRTSASDFNGEIGGKFIANKLWFWFGARYQKNEVNVLGCIKPDGDALHDDEPEHLLHAEDHLSDEPTEQVQRLHHVESSR